MSSHIISNSLYLVHLLGRLVMPRAQLGGSHMEPLLFHQSLVTKLLQEVTYSQWFTQCSLRC